MLKCFPDSAVIKHLVLCAPCVVPISSRCLVGDQLGSLSGVDFDTLFLQTVTHPL